MRSVELAVGAVVEHDGCLLMIVRGRAPGKGLWSLPGGRVQPGESMAAAVERELFEETGVEVTCGEFVGWVERISADHHFVIMDFRASVKGHKSTPVASDDADEAAWIAKTDVRALPLVDGLAQFLIDHKVI